MVRNYYELLRERAGKYREKPFLCVDDTVYSYAAFLAETDALADCVSSRVKAGWDVLVQAEGIVRQIAAFFALQKLGVRPILAHKGLQQELRDILGHNALQALWTYGSDVDDMQMTELPPRPHAEADVMGVLSSGSTGTPKVMYRTYDSWAGFFPTANEILRIPEDAKLFQQGSLSFTGNLNTLLSVLFAGGTTIMSDVLRCHHWAALMNRYAVNVIYLIPSKLTLLVKALHGKEMFPTVSSLFTGSQLLSPPVIRALQNMLPNAQLILYYGASELNFITYAVVEDPDRPPENLGKPFPGVDVSIRNGLIYVDTPYHVSGAAMPFSVQDCGAFNEKGELLFYGRRTAMVNKGGFKLNLLKLTTRLKAIAGILDAAALPIADEVRGNGAAVWLVKEHGADEREIRQRVRHSIRPEAMPDRIFFVDELPLNDRGKIDAERLRAML